MKPAVNFNRYRSFVVLPIPAAAPTNIPTSTWQLPPEARGAAVQALLDRGFTEAPEASADLCVRLRGLAEEKVKVSEWYRGSPNYTALVAVPEPHQHYRPNLTQVDPSEPLRTTVRSHERSVIVEVFDNKTKEALWAGWSTSRSYRSVDREQITNAVRRILERFPAGNNTTP